MSLPVSARRRQDWVLEFQIGQAGRQKFLSVGRSAFVNPNLRNTNSILHKVYHVEWFLQRAYVLANKQQPRNGILGFRSGLIQGERGSHDHRNKLPPFGFFQQALSEHVLVEIKGDRPDHTSRWALSLSHT